MYLAVLLKKLFGKEATLKWKLIKSKVDTSIVEQILVKQEMKCTSRGWFIEYEVLFIHEKGSQVRKK